MSSLRLRTLQQPSHWERLLEAFVIHQRLVPDEAYKIRDPDALPRVLQSVLGQPSEAHRVWACWARGEEAWLFTCQRLPFEASGANGSLLHVHRYDAAGQLQESGCWVKTRQQDWRRCVS